MKLLPPVLSVVMHSLSHQCYCGSCALAELITAAQSLLVRLDRVLPVLLLISPNMPRFLHTYVMFCNGFLFPNAFCIGFQHLSVTGCDPSYLTNLYRLVSILV